MTKRAWRDLENKMIVLLIFFALSLGTSIHLLSYYRHYDLALSSMQQSALSAHSFAENVIDPRVFVEINTKEDEESELFKETYRQLDEIRRIANLLYLYTVKMDDDGNSIYLVDAWDKNDEFYMPPGTLDEDDDFLSEMLRKSLNDEVQFGDRIIDTEYGIVYPVFFPFHDSEGNVIGAIGMEFDSEELYDSMNFTRWITVMFTALFIFVFIALALIIVNKVIRQTEHEFSKLEKIANDASKRTMLMLEASPLSTQIFNRRLSIIDCNKAALALFGFTDKQEYKDKFVRYCSPKVQPDGQLSITKAKVFVNQAFEEGYCRFDWMHQSLDATPFPVEIVLVKEEFDGSDVVVGYTRDMRRHGKMMKEIDYRDRLLRAANQIAVLLHNTDRDHSDDALRRSMGIIAEVIDVDSVNLWKNSMDGEIMYCTQILEYSSRKNVYQLNVAYKSDDFIPSWRDTLAKGKSINDIVRKMSPETHAAIGGTGLLSMLIMPVFIQEQFWGFVCFDDYQKERIFNKEEETILFSVTLMFANAFLRNRLIRSIQERNLDLAAAKDIAEQSNLAKGIFLAQMSHEIRTPMNAILGVTELQLRNNTLSQDVEDAFLMVYESGSLLLNIINDILDLTKLDAGKLEIVPEKYDIPSLINDIVQLNRLRYDSKPIDFKLSVAENTPVELIGDEFRIKQILNNLLSNAYKYTETGEIVLSLAARPVSDEIVTLTFQVSDTGQGMSQSQINMLYDDYSRFNMQENSSITGTGLGMPITKRLTEMMDGEITVVSELGKGTVFTINMPQKRGGTEVCGPEIADKLQSFNFRDKLISKMSKLTPKQMPNGRVLIVDDVYTNLYVAQGMMLPYGLSVDVANSGFEAIDKIRNGEKYDIVFMDHMMPKMDGLETTKRIREMGYTRPVVALTANAVIGQSEMFLENGFDAFVAKPIDSFELDQLLTRIIKFKETPVSVEDIGKAPDSPKVSVVFEHDARNAINILDGLADKLGNLDEKELGAYVVTVHGIKSALASIGEKELSGVAYKLEKAGGNRNFSLIMSETPAFVEALSSLLAKAKSKEENSDVDISDEDKTFMLEKFDDIKAACEVYNMKDAKKALADLKEKAWPRLVEDIYDEISVGLLRGEFKKVMSIIKEAGSTYST